MDLEDPNGWPSSDTIWIVTTASAKDVRSWFPERLAPDDVLEGFEASLTPVEKYEVPKGSRHRCLVRLARPNEAVQMTGATIPVLPDIKFT